jgi:hypothetical protein
LGALIVFDILQRTEAPVELWVGILWIFLVVLIWKSGDAVSLVVKWGDLEQY